MSWFTNLWRSLFGYPRPTPSPPAPQPVPVKPPLAPTSSTLSLVNFARISETPGGLSPSSIVRSVAATNYGKIDATGWNGIIDTTGRLDISRAKLLWIVMLHGVAAHDSLYVDRALLGVVGVMSYQGKNGDFPTQDFGETRKSRSLHHKAITLEGIAQALHMVRSSPFYVGSRMAIIDSLVAKVGLSAHWMANSEDMTKFFRDTVGQSNQFLSIIGFLHTTGVLTKNASLQTVARARLQWVFTNMVSPDGVFRESGGFDSNYQLVSARLLAGYIMLLPPGSWRESCIVHLRIMLRRWTQVIDPNTGIIDDSSNTRTGVDDKLEPGETDGWSNVVTYFSLALGGYVCGPTGFPVPLDVLAVRQIKAGQTLSHLRG